jgi:uncharacterized membrane protein
MKKVLSYSYLLVAISVTAIGIIGMVTGEFQKGFLPMPHSLPARPFLSYALNAVFILSGLGIFFRKCRLLASVTLFVYCLILFIFPHIFKLISNVTNGGEWAAAFEVIALACGAFFIAESCLFQNSTGPGHAPSRIGKVASVISYAFAISLAVFGVLHFIYGVYISTLIPVYFPAKLFLAYFIGIAFISTAVSILINRWSQLSTALLGAMFMIWFLILHAPRAISALNVESEWTSMFIALGICGSSWALCNLDKLKARSLITEVKV